MACTGANTSVGISGIQSQKRTSFHHPQRVNSSTWDRALEVQYKLDSDYVQATDYGGFSLLIIDSTK